MEEYFLLLRHNYNKFNFIIEYKTSLIANEVMNELFITSIGINEGKHDLIHC